MSSSLPDGYTLRAARPDDATAVAALMNVVEAPFGGDADTSADDVLDDWRAATQEHEVWLAERAGRLAASLEVWVRTEERANVDFYVHPEAWDDVARPLLELGENRAREWGPAQLHCGILERDLRARSLLEAVGFEPVRRFFRMKIELDGEPELPVWPAGLRVEPFDLERDGRAVHAATQEAFASEWGFTPDPYERWRDRKVGSSGYDPELWVVVHDADEVAAATTCDRKAFGMGWIASVAVRPAWRRRGLGLAMLHEAFRRFYASGERVVGLGVDANNTTGATRLYERAGMSVAWAATVYEKQLR